MQRRAVSGKNDAEWYASMNRHTLSYDARIHVLSAFIARVLLARKCEGVPKAISCSPLTTTGGWLCDRLALDAISNSVSITLSKS